MRVFFASSWQSCVMKPTFHFTICMCVQYHGGYHEYRGGISWVRGLSWVLWGYHDARGGYHEYRGGCSVPCGETSWLSSLQWTPRAPYGASYMYKTHHLNNYHHNSRSIGTMWGFVWDPFKSCFWATSSIVTAADLSGIIWDPLVQVFSGRFHTVITTADLAGIMWSSIWDPHGQVFGVASTLSSLDQTPQVSWGCIWDPPKKIFYGSSCTILTPVGPRASFGTHFGSCNN